MAIVLPLIWIVPPYRLQAAEPPASDPAIFRVILLPATIGTACPWFVPAWRSHSPWRESDAPLDDWIEVAVFSRPKSGKEAEEKVLHLEKPHVTQQRRTVKLVVDSEPYEAGENDATRRGASGQASPRPARARAS